MQANYIVLALVLGYMAAMGLISFYAKRFSTTAHTFTSGTTGSHGFPAILIGFLLMSEFIGTAASVGTVQEAYNSGISASWNLIALGAGFLLYAFLLAHRFKESGENTISGVLAQAYGPATKLATSVIMIFALQIVAVSVYASGGAILAGLLALSRSTAIVITGVVAVVYVSMGGMRSVIYTNIVHALVKYLGVVVTLAFGISRVGGLSELKARLPAEMFAIDGVGWPQIIAWLVAGIGATFSTQYVIQAISTVSDGRKARWASFYTALLMVPFGICAALVGMCARLLYPNIDSLQAFPTLIAQMDNLMAGIVVAGLSASLFGTISALSIGTATLLYKDFYLTLFKNRPEDHQSLTFVRVATVLVGLLPIPLAIFTPKVLAVTFLAKSLRAALAVLVLLVFYAPNFGTSQGALISIIASLVVTIGWFLAGNPFGIDNAYLALLIPIVVMCISQVMKQAESRPELPAR